jgi:hypothetical protein
VRAHFNRALLDRQGNQVDTAQIRLLLPGTTDLFPDIIYSDATSGSTRPNPWVTASGEVDFYLDSPTRVKVGVTVGTDPEEFWDNVDVTAVTIDSTHVGLGVDSTQVGLGATAAGAAATAVGRSASATADQTTSVGFQASATNAGSVAAGVQASATQPGAVALGRSAQATGSQSTAVGDGAHALHDQATALGAGVQTDRPGQVKIGTVTSLVDISGVAVLHSPDGTAFTVQVTNDGLLYAQRLAPYEAPPPPDEG